MCQMAPSVYVNGTFPILTGHLTISMRQKAEKEIWSFNAYLYDVASTPQFYNQCTCTSRVRECHPREVAGGLSREYVLRIPSVS